MIHFEKFISRTRRKENIAETILKKNVSFRNWNVFFTQKSAKTMRKRIEPFQPKKLFEFMVKTFYKVDRILKARFPKQQLRWFVTKKFEEEDEEFVANPCHMRVSEQI